MRIALVRHGIAGRAPVGGADEDRALTPAGVRRLEKLAAFLRGAPWKVTHLYTSPLLRARQTAGVLGDALGLEAEVERLMAPGATAAEAHEVASRGNESDVVMLVGHQPDMSVIAREFCGEELRFDEGALALIEANSGIRGAKLISFVRGDSFAE